jgi:thiol-disulfide isomerase/thioredoxin
MRQNAVIVAAALLAGGLGLWLALRLGAPGPDGAARIGELAPALELPDLDGRRQRVVPGDGRPQLINYWATWCGPCVHEMPLLDRYATEQEANGVQVTGIALDQPAAVKAFLARVPVRYRNLIEREGRRDSSVQLGNTRQVLPYSVLLDADGRILRLRAGAFRDAQDLQRWATPD